MPVFFFPFFLFLELSPAGVFRLPKIQDIMATGSREGRAVCVLDFEEREEKEGGEEKKREVEKLILMGMVDVGKKGGGEAAAAVLPRFDSFRAS